MFEYDVNSPINWEWGLKRDNGTARSRGWWRNVSMNRNLTTDKIRLYADKLDWYFISSNTGIKHDYDFLEEFKDKIYWIGYIRAHKPNEEFYKRFKEHTNLIYFFQCTCEDKFTMIEKYYDEVENKSELFRVFRFKQDFLERHINDFGKEEWREIASNQKMSVNFIKQHKDKINAKHLLNNPYVPAYLKDKIENGEF